MIKKKNYKQEEHFSTTFSMNVLSQSGKRHLVYYKRYRNSQSNNVSVYELMNNAHKNKNTESKKKVSGYS